MLVEPTGVLELAAATAFCRSSRVRPRAESWSRSASTRTAYCCDPQILTWATPGSVASSGWMLDWAKRSISDMRAWSEVSAMKITGWSAGLTFLKLGGVVISLGS